MPAHPSESPFPGPGSPKLRPWQRLHAALMPDYNRRATACWWAMAVVGYGLIGSALLALASRSPQVWLHVAVGMGLAMLAGLFPVRIPGTRHSFVASDVFIFLLLLLHGPAAAAVAVAGEAFMGSLRTSKRWTSRLGSPAISAIAISLSGSLFEGLRAALGLPAGALGAGAVAATAVTGAQPWPGANGVALLLALAMAAGLLYFFITAALAGGVLRVKRNEPFFQLADLVSIFGWVGMAYAGSAALATLLMVAYGLAGVGVWLVMLPLLAMLLVALHFYFRQQESAAALRERTAEAEARAAEAARRHLRELQASEGRFHGAFTHAAIGMALLGFDGRILQANGALGTLLGRPAGALAGRNLLEFVPSEPGAGGDLLRARLADAAQGRFGDAAVELCFAVGLRPDAAGAAGRADETSSPALPPHKVWAALHFAAFAEGSSGAPCLIVQAQDITGRRVAEAQLHELAFHDTLTGLPNRRRFMQCLEGAVARALADPHYGYAVMYLDFDRFKLVNDSLGHGAGDALLVQLARRLQARLRPSDVVARLGGDEFALLTERSGPAGADRASAHERDVHALAERLLETMREPFEVAGQELQVSASIGITFSRVGYLRAEEVLRDADTAMYKAKADGRARIVPFDGSLHAKVSRRLRLEGDLRRALDQGQLSVAYQPVFELRPSHTFEGSAPHPRSGLRAVEALVRWQHPTEGLLTPADFLPIAEESGLMPRISDFVLHTACRQVRAWQTSHAAWADLSVSVNVAAQDLAEPGYAARVQAALLASGLRGEHLTLELTENILMSRIEGAVATLAELRRLGVLVAVDDFGTGYSSLSYLARLPIDMLKIDRSFVSHLTADGDQAAVVRAILHLGQSLRKAIVAEGIESSRQLEQLLALGCQLGQGHHLAEPLDAAGTGELLGRMRAGEPVAGALHLH